MQIGTPFPFPAEAISPFVEGLEAIVVFEELDHVLEDELLKFAGRTKAGFEVFGKLTGTTLDRGENSVDDCLERIAGFLGVLDALDVGLQPGSGQADSGDELELSAPEPTCPTPELPMRPPVLCAGCPHRGSFYAVKKALKKLKQQAIFCGDIGCYTLGNAQPLDAVDTCLCMGAGITIAQGLSIVEPGKKHLAFVGDSTFFASGLTGVVNAVYNNHDITVVVLDNSLTAMTGGQPHPGTGTTLMGQHNAGLSIEAVLEAIGFRSIHKTNPYDLEESIAIAAEAIDFMGPSALLYEAPCITLVEPKKPVHIDVDNCNGCKKCIREIGCPSIGFDLIDGCSFINEALCTGCGLCISICPFDAIERGKSNA